MSDEELRQLFDTMRQENAAAHEETRRVLRDETAASHEETRRVLREESAAAHEETRAVFRQEIVKAVDDAKRVMRHEGELDRRNTRELYEINLDKLESTMQFLGEGIQLGDQKLERHVADIRAEMRSGFVETQAMIKFSHADLDRRITALEDPAAKNN